MMDKDLYQAATENFNLPHDMVQLPSGGIFYKSKKKSVKVGYLTAVDENLLSSSNIERDGLMMTLLRSKVYEHDLRPEELLDVDIQAILLFLRNTSFGPEYNMSVLDPRTNKYFDSTIVLDELNITRPTNVPDESGFFETTLPKTKVVVKLKPLSYGEETEIEKTLEKYPAGLIPPTVTMKLQKQIVEVNGDTSLSTISKFVNELPILDSKHIKNFLRENVPSLDLKRQVKTPSGEIVTVQVAFGVEFFRPFFQ
jgi:hypothetical protein